MRTPRNNSEGKDPRSAHEENHVLVYVYRAQLTHSLTRSSPSTGGCLRHVSSCSHVFRQSVKTKTKKGEGSWSEPKHEYFLRAKTPLERVSSRVFFDKSKKKNSKRLRRKRAKMNIRNENKTRIPPRYSRGNAKWCERMHCRFLESTHQITFPFPPLSLSVG